jgi:hypothetical protein
VRAVTDVRDLSTFRRFLSLLATRTGQTLNRTDLAAPLGLSIPTISQWIGVLETTAQILLIPPYFENLGKRLVKSPKLYCADPGLVCHLLGIESAAALERSPFLGPVFEGHVAAEIAKGQIGRGKRREIYFFRDHQGLEVDFLVPAGSSRLLAVEAEASRTARPDMAAPLLRLAPALRGRGCVPVVVHRPPGATAALTALRPGVQALGLDDLLDLLFRERR